MANGSLHIHSLVKLVKQTVTKVVISIVSFCYVLCDLFYVRAVKKTAQRLAYIQAGNAVTQRVQWFQSRDECMVQPDVAARQRDKVDALSSVCPQHGSTGVQIHRWRQTRSTDSS